jgi:hypothetical protein
LDHTSWSFVVVVVAAAELATMIGDFLKVKLFKRE